MSSSGEEQKTPLDGSQNSGQAKDSTKGSGTIEEEKQSEKEYSAMSKTDLGDHLSGGTQEHDGFDNIRRLDALKIEGQTIVNGGISTTSKPEENISQHKEENVGKANEVRMQLTH